MLLPNGAVIFIDVLVSGIAAIVITGVVTRLSGSAISATVARLRTGGHSRDLRTISVIKVAINFSFSSLRRLCRRLPHWQRPCQQSGLPKPADFSYQLPAGRDRLTMNNNLGEQIVRLINGLG